MILTIRTDKQEAEIGLYDGYNAVAYKKWQAHRELSSTIHNVIIELLDSQQKNLSELTGIIFYAGPGSFTGLRIGASVANALSVSLAVPLVQANQDDWIKKGLQRLEAGESEVASPEYGSAIFVTKPKK